MFTLHTRHFLPESPFSGLVLESDVTKILHVHVDTVGGSIKHLISLCGSNKKLSKQNTGNELQKFRTTAQSIRQFTTKTLRDVSTSFINEAQVDIQERTKHNLDDIVILVYRPAELECFTTGVVS